jgi:beta-glucosidase
MRRATLLLAVIAVGVPVAVTAPARPALAAQADTPTYLDPARPPAERAADLVARLTLAEKAAQMNSSMAAALPRLAVAAYGWWNEAGHGVAREQLTDGSGATTLTNTTSYPVDLALGSTWNPDLVYREASLISDEARDVVRDNRLDLSFYTPTINLARDPRWGRNDETFSEDPLLTAALAAQFVNGLQGQTQRGTPLPGSGGYLKAVATLKHFAANNSEFNRRTGSSDMDERTLREYYTAQFRDVIRWSDPGSIMSAYNSINGVPAPADVHLIDTLARQTFGFTGYFTSDCDAVFEIQAGHHWQPPGAPAPLDQYGRTAYAQSAGEDLNCNRGFHDTWSYANTIPTAVTQGITTSTGVYTENDVDVSLVRLFTARIELGEFDAEADVPWVAAARARLAPGTWTNSDANNAVTQTPQRLAMARAVADQSIVLLRNQPVGGRPLLPLSVPRAGAYRVAVIGAYAHPATMYLGGYSSNQGAAGRAHEVDGYQGLVAAIRARNPEATVDFLPGTTPGNIGAVDADSVAAAAGYDAVVVYAGTDESTATEGRDRTTLALPGAQASLISQVAAANPNTVVYLETLGQVDLSGIADRVPAILWSSYNGQQKGVALADVVTGAVNPSGRLPFSWYADLGQLPAIGDYTIRPTATTAGRTYQYFTGDVAYPFGHGLSYTRFRYAHVRVDRTRVDANGDVRVGVDVTNTGRSTGAEVVQLYATTPDSPAALERPAKRLAGFRKLTLRPGETRRVAFDVRVADLAFFDEATDRFAVDRGRYGLQLATSGADGDVRAQASVTVTGALRPAPAVVTAKPVAPGDAAAGIAQRVVFPAGSRIDPRLTVSMSDESIAGYVTSGRSSPLPPGLRVRYDSDHPDVVSTRDGVLTATGGGVATVTARVRGNGGEASGTFVVVVR